MDFWNYIGEFFLFRWLFSSHRHNETQQNISDTSSGFGNKDIIDVNDTHFDFGRHENSYDYGYSQSYDDFHDEQDDYDMMDDDF